MVDTAFGRQLMEKSKILDIDVINMDEYEETHFTWRPINYEIKTREFSDEQNMITMTYIEYLLRMAYQMDREVGMDLHYVVQRTYNNGRVECILMKEVYNESKSD